MVVFATGNLATRIFEFSLGIVLLLLGARRFWLCGVYDATPADRIWYRFSIWLFIWCIAACFRSLEVMSDQPGYGVISDYFWIAGYLPLVDAAYLRYVSSSPAGNRRLIVIALLACATLVLLVGPLIRNPARSFVFKALDILYAAFDLSAATVLIAGNSGTTGDRILIISLLLLLSSDIVFSYSDGQSFYLKFSFLTAYFLFSVAAGTWLRKIEIQRNAQLVIS